MVGLVRVIWPGCVFVTLSAVPKPAAGETTIASRAEPRGAHAEPRPRTDAVLRWLARYALSVYFRRIDVVGADRFPADAPVIVVANHFNSLVDGVLLTAFLPRIPRLMAATNVWAHKPLVPLLNAAGVIRLFRRQDDGIDRRRSENTFAEAIDLLNAGGVLTIFPEGVSHNEPFVMPLKSGAARIALEAEERDPTRGVMIVPVGLVFDAKARFRSRALIQIGAPIPAAAYLAGFTQSDRAGRLAAIRELTRRIRHALIAVAPHFASWEGARLIGRVAEIFAQPQPDLPTRITLAEGFQIRSQVREGYVWLQQHHPDRAAAIREKLAAYDQLLQTAGLRDAQVGAAYPRASAMSFAVRTLFTLIIRLPLTVVGLALNWVPYQISRLISRRQDLDKTATWMIFPGLIVFPAYWILAAGLAGLLTELSSRINGGLVAASVMVLAPFTGRVTLRFFDAYYRFLHEVRAWMVLRTRRKLAGELARQRADILSELNALSALYQNRGA